MNMGSTDSHSNTEEEQSAQWWVFCLCAGWCGVCREYREGFEALHQKFPQVRWGWVDVEDQEDLVGELDVETFPTLLIGRGQQAMFLGPLLPQHRVLERLVGAFLEGASADSGIDPSVSSLFVRVVQDQLQRQNAL